MLAEQFKTIVRQKLGYDFSPSQQRALDEFVSFFFEDNHESLFLLKGYAGSGKTSLVAAIVNTLVGFEIPVSLLAPTGRAAKVFSGYSGQTALTIASFTASIGSSGCVGTVALSPSSRVPTQLFIRLITKLVA